MEVAVQGEHWCQNLILRPEEVRAVCSGLVHQAREAGLILDELLKLATTHGFHAVIARIVGDHEASIALHDRCGFTFVGVEKEVGRGLIPPLGGVVVWGIGLSLGGPTGYAINPARDFGPRLAHFLLPIPGKGPSDWGYAWVPIIGPVTGALLAALLAKQVMTQ